MKPLRVGIVGAGFGAVAHLPALTHHPDFDVVALASPTNAARIAREQAHRNAYDSVTAMLAGCDLDAVTVASPPFSHVPTSLAALAAGKARDVRKTLRPQRRGRAGNARGLARGRNGLRRRPRVPLRTRKRKPSRNSSTTIISIRCANIEITLLRSMLRRTERRPRSWWFERERGGGLAGAVLSHLVDHADWLAARPAQRDRRISAHGQSASATTNGGPFISTVDDGAFALIDYGDGLVARITVDGTTAVESYTCAVHGEERTAVASGPTIIDLTLYTIDQTTTDELTCKPSPYAQHGRSTATFRS